MKTSAKVKGIKGELIAKKFLQSQGVKIVAQNFKSKFGEIDLIGEEKKTLISFEVKARSSLRFGKPYEAVNSRKLQKIKKTLEYFLLENPKYKDWPLRIDVVSLLTDKEGNVIEIKRFKNVL